MCGAQLPQGCPTVPQRPTDTTRLPPRWPRSPSFPTNSSGRQITSGLPHGSLGTRNYLRVAPQTPPDPKNTSGLPHGSPEAHSYLRTAPTVPGGDPYDLPRGVHSYLKAPPRRCPTPPHPPPPAHSPAAAGRGPHGAAGGPAPAGPAATQRACAETPAAAQARPTPLQRAQARCR